MKTLNLVMAIVYTVILGISFLGSLGSSDTDIAVGTIILSGPVVANWLTWNYLKKNNN